MSIYPVRLDNWYPSGDEMRWAALSIIKHTKCKTCGKRNINPKWAYIYHSAPYGGFHGEVWCSKKCFESKNK